MEILLDALAVTQTITLPIPGGVTGDTYTLTWYFPETPDDNSMNAECDADGNGNWTWDRLYTERIIAKISTEALDPVTAEFEIDFVRPYASITNLVEQLSITTAVAKQSEKIARLIIESQAGAFGYYNEAKVAIGGGTDTLVLPDRLETLQTVYVNDELLHDSSNLLFKTGPTKNTLIPIARDNRLEYPTVWNTRYQTALFVDGYDYEVTGDWGFRFVPSDITEACEILVQDVTGGNLKYVQKNITQFSNTEFSITFAKGFAQGTGNSIVDNLLLRYKNRISPGIL